MLRGLPASIFLHAAFVGVGYLSWPYMSASTTDEALTIVPVELVDLGAFTNIASVIEPEPDSEDEVVPEDQPEDPELEDVVDPEDPVDETLPEDEFDTASSEPLVQPQIVEDTVPDFQDDAPDALEDLLKAPDQSEAPIQRPVDPLDAVLSDADSTFASERETRRKTEPPKPRPQPVLTDRPKPQAPRKGAGERTANTARLEALLYSQIYTCWDGVDDQPDAKNLNVRLSVQLDENGNLKGRIRWIEPSREPLGRSPMRVAMERARRAVQKCAPYKLPKQEYAEWETVYVNLGPAFESTVTE